MTTRTIMTIIKTSLATGLVALGAALLGGGLSGCKPTAQAEDIPTVPTATHVAAASPVEAGRYLVDVAGCNDCHTAGFMQLGEAVPEPDRLLGSPVGFQGPWGTTYAPNLRLTVQKMTEDDWVQMLRTRDGMPPMPWPAVKALSEQDARAIYQYLQHLGPAGA
ncbi:MAG: hypothetical protein GVY18_11435, partial [Bacteroidetes bacterium]|nr:hypothetical protein [Bacteroidota bacterium]